MPKLADKKDTEADKPAEVEKGTVAKKDVVVEKPTANAAKEASAKQLPTTGFEVPQRGAVCYGGRDLARLDARALRRNIGVVLQGEKLFGGSIYDNIAISAPGLSLDNAWAAVELAGVADDIRAMPMSMHTMISEGGRLVAVERACYAGLDDGRHVLDRVFAIAFQPFADHGHHALHEKRHKVGPVGFRHVEALQNRGEHLREHTVVHAVQVQHIGFFHGRAEQPAMLFDVGEERHKIFWRDQVQLIFRARGQAGDDDFGVLPHGILELAVHALDAFVDQITQRFVVQVERRAVHARLRADFLHRDVGEVLFLKQRQKRVVHLRSRGEVFAFGPV